MRKVLPLYVVSSNVNTDSDKLVVQGHDSAAQSSWSCEKAVVRQHSQSIRFLKFMFRMTIAA